VLELTVRLVVSLAIVVGLLLLLARVGGRKFRGSADAPVRVVHRQPLSRTSAVALVQVGERVLVLGTTEHQVSVLTELSPDELDPALLEAPGTRPTVVDEMGTVLELPGRTGTGTGTEGTPSFDDVLAAEQARAATARAAGRPGRHAAPRAASPKRAARPARPARAPRPGTPAAAAHGALTGSVLSPQTWKQAFAAATRRAS